MNSIKLAAPLVALVLCPACGGQREQAPQPASPAPSETSAVPPAPTATESGTSASPGASAPTPEAPPKPSLTELQRTAIRSLQAAFNAHDAAKIATLYAPDARLEAIDEAEGWKEESGAAAIQDVYKRIFDAFPDVRLGTTRAYQSNDVVISEWITTGTHKAETGARAAVRPIAVNGASIFWFDDAGRIVRDHAYSDPLEATRQATAKKGTGRAAPQPYEGEIQFITATGRAEDTRWLDPANTFFAALTSRNDEKSFLGLFAKDAAFTYYDHPADRTGAAGAREIYKNLSTAFPDVRLASKSLWGFGDRIAAEVVLTGTQKGAYLGARSTNKPATLHELDFLRFDDSGKIVEVTHYGSGVELTHAGQTRKSTADQTPAQQKPGYDMSPGHGLYPPGSSPNPYPGPSLYPPGSTPPYPGSGTVPGGRSPSPGGTTPAPGGATPSPTQNP